MYKKAFAQTFAQTFVQTLRRLLLRRLLYHRTTQTPADFGQPTISAVARKAAATVTIDFERLDRFLGCVGSGLWSVVKFLRHVMKVQ